jgi:hypothetical protein
MFRFETKDGKEVKAFFRYEHEDVPANPHKKTSKPHRRPVGTTCMLADEDDNVIGIGAVRCYYKERFRYMSGRKYALKQAMKDAGFDRDTRARAWEEFLQR